MSQKSQQHRQRSPNNSDFSPADPLFVLASGSPRRREFMELLALPFIVVTPAAAGNPVDETPRPDEQPMALVQRLSRIKAGAVAGTLPRLDLSKFGHSTPHLPENLVVLAADTVVVLNGQVLGKPNSPAEATQMLKQLRQEPHFVYSGITAMRVNRQGQIMQSHTRPHQSRVQMRAYADTEIDAYIAGGDPLDKAGAYGIQDQTFAPVANLEGCFASVMGFPLGELAIALRKLGIELPPVSPLCSRHTHHPCCQK